MRWTAVVLAGSRPGTDPFAEAHGTDLKTLIPVAGVPMVRRPVDALLATDLIGDILVLTQEPERIGAVLPADPRIRLGRSAATIADTILQLCDDPSVQWPLLVTTADHALLDPAMVRDFCMRTTRCDIAIGVVERRQLARKISRRIGLVIRAVEPANPLAAVDVDKPADLELVERILAQRA
jgi:GTP:adenosylcobinamide-phosphate guanylyltransferase